MAASRRLTGEQIRQQTIEAFLAEAMARGIHAVTLQMAAKSAKVAYSSAHYYFGGDGKDIVDATVSYVAKSAQSFVESALNSALLDPRRNTLECYAAANIDWAIERPTHASFWVYFYYLSSFMPKYQLLHQQHLAEARARTQMLLQIETVKGNLPALKNSDELANKFHTALVGALFVGGVEGMAANRERILASMQRMLSDFLTAHGGR